MADVMTITATPFLMFEGRAEEALEYWKSVIPGFEVTRPERWGAKGPGREGQIGKVLMPLGEYGFSRRFGWVNDRFGVSWQINLPHA